MSLWKGPVRAACLEPGDYLVRDACYVDEAYDDGYDGIWVRTSDGYAGYTDRDRKYLIERRFDE